MNPAYLIKMANQIGAFFEAMPDREQAIKDVAGHILRSWDPRMRRDLMQYVGDHGDGDLKAVVRDALPSISDATGPV